MSKAGAILAATLLAACGGATPAAHAPGSGGSPSTAAAPQAGPASAGPSQPRSSVRFECQPAWELTGMPPGNNVAPVAVDDPAILAARKEAVASLATFRRGLAAGLPPSVVFSLKVGLPTRKGGTDREHIWVSDIQVDGEGFRGVLDNDPVDIDLAAGDVVQIAPAQIEDWMILDAERSPPAVCGGFTTRVLLDRQPR